MEVRIEIQMSPEGVRHHNNKHTNTVLNLHPSFYGLSSDRRQLVKEAAIPLENWPENVGHRKVNAHIGNIGEISPQVPLPKQCLSVPTTRTWASNNSAVTKTAFPGVFSTAIMTEVR